jgi:hypothetical protein
LNVQFRLRDEFLGSRQIVDPDCDFVHVLLALERANIGTGVVECLRVVRGSVA